MKKRTINSVAERLLLPIGLILTFVEDRAEADISLVKETTCPQVQPCRIHLQAATRFFTKHSYADALREFNNAYGEQPDPRLLLNIGRTHLMLNQPAEAMKYYRRCEEAAQLDISLDNELRAKLAEYIAQAQKQLDAQKEKNKQAKESIIPATSAVSEVEPPPAPLVQPDPLVLSTNIKPAEAVKSLAVESPVYKKWWFWGLVGVAAAGVGTSAGLLAARQPSSINGNALDSRPTDTYKPAIMFIY